MNESSQTSSARRAALFILSIEPDVAAEVLRHLDPRDLKRLAELTATLQQTNPDTLDPVFEEFDKSMRGPLPIREGSDHMRKLITTVIGVEKTRELLHSPTDVTVDREPIETIRAARAATLAELLLEEQPQVAAVIISQLLREQAAAVVVAMPAERQSDLLARIAQLKEVPAHAVQIASESLAKALESSSAHASEDVHRVFDGVAFAAGVLNELPPGDSERLLGTIQDTNEKLAPKIREAMFTFEDLGRVEARGLPMLMREVQSDQLLIALKTASESLRDKFLSALSSRAAEAMRDDLALMPPTRLADVEQAQREIVTTALKMAADQRLTIMGSKAEKLV